MLEKSAERKAFEELPSGYLTKEAGNFRDEDELNSAYEQAFSQARRFEVLKTNDVDALSKVSKLVPFIVKLLESQVGLTPRSGTSSS